MSRASLARDMALPKRGSRRWKALTTRRLSAEQLWELRAAVVSNAASLLADAETLLETQGYPRAYAIAYTAFEETSKTSEIFAMYLTLLAGVPLSDEDWVRFWTRWSSHPLKSQYAGAIEAMFRLVLERYGQSSEPPHDVALVIEEIVQIVKSSAELGNATAVERALLRDAALYVDWSGSPARPEDRITPDLAEAMLRSARDAVYFAQGIGEVVDNQPDVATWMARLAMAAFGTAEEVERRENIEREMRTPV